MVVLDRITSSGVARGDKGGQLPPGATRRRTPKSISIVASEEGGHQNPTKVMAPPPPLCH